MFHKFPMWEKITRSRSIGNIHMAIGRSFDQYASQWSNGTSFGENDQQDRSQDINEARNIEAQAPSVELDSTESPSYSELLSRVSSISLNTNGTDVDILNQRATPGISGIKRSLFISPSTPVGKIRKEMRMDWSECSSPDLTMIDQRRKLDYITDGLDSTESDGEVRKVPVLTVKYNEVSGMMDGNNQVPGLMVENNQVQSGIPDIVPDMMGENNQVPEMMDGNNQVPGVMVENNQEQSGVPDKVPGMMGENNQAPEMMDGNNQVPGMMVVNNQEQLGARKRTYSVNDRLMFKDREVGKSNNRGRTNSLSQLRRKKTVSRVRIDPKQQLIHNMLRTSGDKSD